LGGLWGLNIMNKLLNALGLLKEDIDVSFLEETSSQNIYEDMEGSTSLGDVSQFTPILNINKTKVQRRLKLRRKKCRTKK